MLTLDKGEFDYWSHLPDLNRGPSLYKSVALPTELRWRYLRLYG